MGAHVTRNEEVGAVPVRSLIAGRVAPRSRLLALVFALPLAWVSLSAGAAVAAPNACGCYRDGSGSCLCNKKAKCGCPGDCEPKGCEEKRAKQIEKEIQAETKKAQAASRDAHAKAKQGEEQQARQERAKEERSKDERSKKDRDAKPAPEHKAKVVHMTAAERANLRKLLDLYVGEHPDQQNRSIGEVRSGLR